VVFTELRDIQQVGARSAIIGIGSREQPFKIFLPDIEGAPARSSCRSSRGATSRPAPTAAPWRAPAAATPASPAPSRRFTVPEVVVTRPDQVQDAAP